MSAVWKSEYEKLLDLVTALLATHDPGVAWTLVGEHFLETHFDAEVFTVNTVSAASGTSQVPHSTPSWVAERVPPPTALHQLFSNHPLVVHLQNAPHPMAIRRSSDAIAMSTWLNSETHSQLQATLGISHQLAIPLPRRDGAMRTVVLMRPATTSTTVTLRSPLTCSGCSSFWTPISVMSGPSLTASLVATRPMTRSVSCP